MESKSVSLPLIVRFLEKSPQASIFAQPWWLEAVAPGQWEYLTVEKNGEIVALLPIVKKQGRFKRLSLTQPKLTQTLGVMLCPLEGKYANQISRQIELTNALIEKLPEFSYFSQSFNYNFTNWLPFYWNGFQQTTFYTYVIEDLTNMEKIWSNLQKNIRTDIKKAKKKVEIRDDLGINRFLDINEMVFARQGIKLPYTREFVKRLDAACEKNNVKKIFFAVDSHDLIHAAIYIVWNDNSAYYIMGGSDPDLRNSGANSLVIWEAIQFASQVSKCFDFEGSMIKPVERFFRSFGGTQKPYLNIYKDTEKNMGTIGKLKKRYVRNI